MRVQLGPPEPSMPGGLRRFPRSRFRLWQHVMNRLRLEALCLLPAVDLAAKHLITIPGIESFRIGRNRFLSLDYTGYAFEFRRDWPSYVQQNNQAALSFIEEYPLGEGHVIV